MSLLNKVIEKNEKGVRIATIVAMAFMVAYIFAGAALWMLHGLSYSMFFFFFIFYELALTLPISVIALLASYVYIYRDIGKDNERASSTSLVLGIVLVFSGNVISGIVLLIARQFIVTRLELHYNFK